MPYADELCRSQIYKAPDSNSLLTMFYTKEQPGFAYMHCYDIESGLFNFIDAEISDIIDDSPKEYDSELRRVFIGTYNTYNKKVQVQATIGLSERAETLRCKISKAFNVNISCLHECRSYRDILFDDKTFKDYEISDQINWEGRFFLFIARPREKLALN